MPDICKLVCIYSFESTMVSRYKGTTSVHKYYAVIRLATRHFCVHVDKATYEQLKPNVPEVSRERARELVERGV